MDGPSPPPQDVMASSEVANSDQQFVDELGSASMQRPLSPESALLQGSVLQPPMMQLGSQFVGQFGFGAPFGGQFGTPYNPTPVMDPAAMEQAALMTPPQRLPLVQGPFVGSVPHEILPQVQVHGSCMVGGTNITITPLNYLITVPQGSKVISVKQGNKNLLKPRRGAKQNVLLDRLELLFGWYNGMVSPEHGRLMYSYSPVGDPDPKVCVIRDIGAVWELELLSHFLGKVELNDVIEHCLEFFNRGLVKIGSGIGYALDSRFLGEPSTIAHSAMLLLGVLWDNVRRYNSITGLLASGLLNQQRPDGSFKVHFGDEPDGPLWMYGCEAICALAEAYRWLRDARYARAVDQGMRFYDTQVFLKGYVEPQLLPFFVSWQCHACRLLFDAAGDSSVWGNVPPSAIQHRFADYSYRMVDRLVKDGFFDDFARPPYVTSVALSCALEGMNDAYAMAKVLREEGRVELYYKCIRKGIQYLLSLQCTKGYARPEKERGGFALTVANRNQRVDFSGPAARAMMKTLTNGIECPRPLV